MSRILLVEDDLDLAENVHQLLGRIGEVEACTDADAAAEAVRSRRFDLALMDVRLASDLEPRTALDLLPLVREHSPDAEIVLMSGYATLDSALEAVRQGVFAYVPKPFDPRGLLALAERALSQVALRRERKQLSKELGRSEALHRAVFDAVDELIVGLDKSHRIQLWNRAAAAATGWSLEEALDQNACDLLLDASQRGLFDHAVESASRGEGTGAFRVLINTRAGEQRVVQWTARPLSPDGAPPRMVVVAGTDVTERLALERRAADAEAMAAMGRLTSALAHEIRNPINAAKLQLEVLRRSAMKLENGADAIQRRVEVIGGELSRLSHLLDDFMGLARPKHLTLHAVELEDVVNGVAHVQRPTIESAGLSLEVEIGDGLCPSYADEGRLKQAMMHLVTNAIDALQARGSGTIRLAALRDGRVQELRVEDDGPGLDQPEDQVVAPFVTTKKTGTGLGLPFAKKITEMHGGQLLLRPRDGGGTTVRIRLPVIDANGVPEPG
ncbi:MAG: ATP-binding protein [Sandaracinaceae bacterium]